MTEPLNLPNTDFDDALEQDAKLFGLDPKVIEITAKPPEHRVGETVTSLPMIKDVADELKETLLMTQKLYGSSASPLAPSYYEFCTTYFIEGRTITNLQTARRLWGQLQEEQTYWSVRSHTTRNQVRKMELTGRAQSIMAARSILRAIMAPADRREIWLVRCCRHLETAIYDNPNESFGAQKAEHCTSQKQHQQGTYLTWYKID
jgi:hypothetical protein